MKKIVRVLYRDNELRVFKQEDIIKEEENIYAPDYNLIWGNYLEIVKKIK